MYSDLVFPQTLYGIYQSQAFSSVRNLEAERTIDLFIALQQHP